MVNNNFRPFFFLLHTRNKTFYVTGFGVKGKLIEIDFEEEQLSYILHSGDPCISGDSSICRILSAARPTQISYSSENSI